MKRWKMAEAAPAEAGERLNQPRLLASLLWRRGIRTAEDAERFLSPIWERDIHDPALFLDMEKAVARLLRAIGEKEKIVVHGDYDADGVSGSVILHATLKALGADVSVYLPHREKEGYGMNAPAVERLAAEGAKVIVTCDCGVSNAPEIALAASLGVDTIITDHHTLPPELPPAHAILHPLREGETYPFRGLTGGGVAFKLCQALWKAGNLPVGQEKWLLDMVSISTVADMGPLTGENRALVHFGLTVLNKTRRLGLKSLIDGFRRGEETLDAQSIGFRIAPRINAAGRMEHADAAFALLTAETSEEAALKAEVLHGHNRDRQSATETIVAEARQLAAAQSENAAIVVAGDGWPAALCGLVASKLVDDHDRPVIALGRDAEGKYVGSGRSVPGFDVTAALRRASEFLVRFGGHPAACGLTLQGDANFEAFKKSFLEDASEKLSLAELESFIEIEEEAAIHEISIGLVEELAKLEPHGVGNPRPRFLLRGAHTVSSQVIGQEWRHLRLVVTDGKGRLKLIGFGFGEMATALLSGSLVQVVVELERNAWNGRVEPQGRIVDLRLDGEIVGLT